MRKSPLPPPVKPPDPDERPQIHVTDGKWYLDATDGQRWTVYHCSDSGGRPRRVSYDRADFRVFESATGELRRYDLGRGERRDHRASLWDRQLQLAKPIARKPASQSAAVKPASDTDARRPDPAKPAPSGWTRLNDGWDSFREHHGWGAPID